jgi:2-oxo-4-hydroxy-4-carboxy--5-ureidoimidazoline (OHCU) decarboxylase
MKEVNFKYKKKDGVIDDYNLMVLNENNTHTAGIALNKLKDEEKAQLVKIQKEYEEKLKPFMKAYRQFIKENILQEEVK